MSLHISDLNISGITNNGEVISFSISARTDREDESMLNITPFNDESFDFLNNSQGSLHLSDLNVSSASNGNMTNYSEGHTSIEGDNSSILPIEHSGENHEIEMEDSIDLSGGRRKTRKIRKRNGRKKITAKKSRKTSRKHK